MLHAGSTVGVLPAQITIVRVILKAVYVDLFL